MFAAALTEQSAHAEAEFGHRTQPPTNFTDPAQMLNVSPALLQGKIIRGGMGTGMPAWGPVFTEAETWALVDYVWSLAFDYRAGDFSSSSAGAGFVIGEP